MFQLGLLRTPIFRIFMKERFFYDAPINRQCAAFDEAQKRYGVKRSKMGAFVNCDQNVQIMATKVRFEYLNSVAENQLEHFIGCTLTLSLYDL